MTALPAEPTFGVVGAGIVGLAVARELSRRLPGARVTVFDKEPRVAAHQSGHNSGVVHAGLYYQPGSLKADLCRQGGALLRDFCAEHGIAYAERGKLVVAVDDTEVAALDEIEARSLANRVPDLRRLDAAQLHELEPAVAGVAALHSPRTAVVDYSAVCVELARQVTAGGGSLRLSCPVSGLVQNGSEVVVTAGGERLRFDHVVACAGLTSDAISAMVGGDSLRIVPFRGEYYGLAPDKAALVRGLVYPVPDPRYPFLGVHLTRDVHDHVHVGPNAVLALALEGYRRRDVDVRDLARTLAWPGALRLLRTHWRSGAREVAGSLSRRVYAARVARYLPGVTAGDLVPVPSGVRAQAVHRDGSMVDDFAVQQVGRVMVVRNAPSPAATSSLAIAAHLVDLLLR
jgi:(S)-2-hydroxyglutarate dehydrogenase